MRAPLVVLSAVLAAGAAALTGCPNNQCSTSGAPAEAAPACYGGCGCGGGCFCDSTGQRVCSRVACRPTCLYDGGVMYPGAAVVENAQTCTCDYSGNINCCPLDGGSCTNACIDSGGLFRAQGETWAGADGGSCTCKTGFVVDCGPNAPAARCSFAGQGYAEGAKVDAGAGCDCSCNSQGHVTCSSPACLPTSCSHQGSQYSTGLIFQADACNFCLCGDDGAMSCTGRQCGAGKCEYAGTVYDAGTSYPSADGCNSCTCQPDGTSSCTAQGCAAVHCVLDGGALSVGTTYLTADRCNVCGCSSDGKIYCTSRPCTP